MNATEGQRRQGRRPPTGSTRPAPRSVRAAAAGLLLLAAHLVSPTAARPGAVDSPGEADRPPRLVLISWDGAADWAIDRLLAEGSLPHLTRLAARGVTADYSVSTFPTKTAAGHAALWTGCWADCNGVANNDVAVLPPAEHTLLEKRSGYRSEALTAEPIFVTAARAGRQVVVLSATQTYPPGPLAAALHQAGVPADRFRSFSGFELEVAPGRVIGEGELAPAGRGWRRVPGGPFGGGRGGSAAPHAPRELVLEVADSTFYALAYDDPRDPVRGLDTLLLRQGSRDPRRAVAEAVLKPREATDAGDAADAADAAGGEPAGWSPPFAVTAGDLRANTYFRLFALAPDGSHLVLYQRRANDLGGIHSAAELAAYRRAYPGFHDVPFQLYDRGDLGPTLADGGARGVGANGTAERRAVELAAFDTDQLIAGTRFALAAWQPDLLVHYSPMGDSAGHSWIGILDPAAPGHDPALAARVWPFYAQVFAQLDRWLGAIVEAAPADTVVALVSDHGMAGASRRFYPNRALEEAGLLARTADGEIDLARTRALVPAFGRVSVHVNDVSWKGGIVPLADRRAVVEAAVRALLDARDPDTGVHPVERVFRPEDLADLGLPDPGRGGGDLYFDTAPGYYPERALAAAVAAPFDHPRGEGEHGYWPRRRAMHAIFYAAGPGLRAGVTLPAIRHVDVAPTLARLIGIPPPAQAEGRVVTEALEAR